MSKVFPQTEQLLYFLQFLFRLKKNNLNLENFEIIKKQENDPLSHYLEAILFSELDE